MNKSFWLRNMVVMGQGSPNKIKKLKGQQGKCACLWSEEKGLCRVYPIPHKFLRDWEIIDIKVRLPTKDRRENSYTLFNYEKEWPDVKSIFIHKHKNRLGNIKHKKLTRKEQVELARKLAKNTFSETRDSKKSFGLIKPKNMKFHLLENHEKPESVQTLITDLDQSIMDQKDYKWLPYLEYTCTGNCTSKHPHKQKIISWEAYTYMKKDPNNYNHCIKLRDNYHINDQEYEHYILIGNMFRYPKSYSIIKIIRFKK